MERNRRARLSEAQQASRNRTVPSKSGRQGTSPPPQRGQEDDGAAFQIFMMRHGIAAKRGLPLSSDDALRPLTAKGKKRVEEIAGALQRLGYEVDWIVTSPLARAAETAEMVAASFPAKVPLDMCEALRPGGSAEDFLSFLAKNPHRKRVLVVGHEPDLSQLAVRLIGASSQANVAFKKGGCCLIQYDKHPSQTTGHLVWWLTPRLLRAIK